MSLKHSPLRPRTLRLPTPVSQNTHPLFDACANKLKILNDRHPGEFTLLATGGIKSEWVAHLLMRLEIPFRVHVIRWRLHDNLDNSFDIAGVSEFCDLHQLPYTEVSVDLRAFFDTGALELANRTGVRDIGLLFGLLMVQNSLGYSIRCSGIPVLGFDQNASPEERVQIHNWPSWTMEREFAKQNSGRCDLSFFSSTDAVLDGYLAEPVLTTWARLTPEVGFSDSRDWEELILRSSQHQLKSRPRHSGLEIFAKELSDLERRLRAQGPQRA